MDEATEGETDNVMTDEAVITDEATDDEPSAKRDAPEYGFYGTPVQTDLTSRYISLMESDIVMLQEGTDALSSEVEETRERMVSVCKEQLNECQKQIGKLKQEIVDYSLNEGAFREKK